MITYAYALLYRVFLGVDLQTQELSAVKILMGGTNSDLGVFRSEIEIHKKMNHSHIIQLKEYYESIDYFDPSGMTFKVAAIITEYAEDGSFFQLLQKYGPFPEILARTYFHQLIAAVESIHSKDIIHRDIKPENILLSTGFNLKIVDFGYSTQVKKGQKLKANAGTSKYFAPEMHNSQSHCGQDADLFALGIILFVMVSGKMPSTLR